MKLVPFVLEEWLAKYRDSVPHHLGMSTGPKWTLAELRALMTDAERADWPGLSRHIAKQTPTFLEERFWPDGEARVSGRETNGMVETPCFKGGTLTCLSCHSMHQSDPNDQLAAGMDGDAACFTCHDEYKSQVQAHTHHAAESDGSLCYNCHMPHTTYGLLKAIRTHLISSPTVTSSELAPVGPTAYSKREESPFGCRACPPCSTGVVLEPGATGVVPNDLRRERALEYDRH